MNSTFAVPAVALVVVATVLVGAFGLRISRTTSDFYVASRTVGPRLNAAAISGEYLSAASFLGIAGLVLVQGPDMLWYPVGYTARLPGPAALRRRPAAPLRRLHPPRLRRGPPRLPGGTAARGRLRRRRRLALPAAPAPGRRTDPDRADRGARLPRRTHRRRRGRRDRRRRRHAQHHLRAGLPVLAQAHRPPRPRPLPDPRLAGRRRAPARLRGAARLPRPAGRPRRHHPRPAAGPAPDRDGDRHGRRPPPRGGRPQPPHAAPTASNRAPASASPRAPPSPPPNAAATAACPPASPQVARNAPCTPRTA